MTNEWKHFFYEVQSENYKSHKQRYQKWFCKRQNLQKDSNKIIELAGENDTYF